MTRRMQEMLQPIAFGESCANLEIRLMTRYSLLHSASHYSHSIDDSSNLKVMWMWCHVMLQPIAFGESFQAREYIYVYTISRIRRVMSRISSTYAYTCIYIHTCIYNLAFGDSFLETSIRRVLFWNLEIREMTRRMHRPRMDMTRRYVTWLSHIWHDSFICDKTHSSMSRSIHYHVTWWVVLQCVVCCSMLQCVAVCCVILESRDSRNDSPNAPPKNLEIPKKVSPDASLEKWVAECEIVCTYMYINICICMCTRDSRNESPNARLYVHICI